MILARSRRVLQQRRNQYLFSTGKEDPKEEWMIKKQIYKEVADYVVPFRTQNKEVRNPLLKSYVYLALSRVCLFGGPIFLKNAVDALKVTGGSIDPLYLILSYGVCFTGSVVFGSFRSL